MMTLSQNPLRIASVLATALMTTFVLFTASAGQARSNPVVYTVQLVVPVEAGMHIIKGTAIQCNGTECSGRKSSSSKKNVCAKIADKIGPVASFAYKGEAMDAEALAKCND